MKEKNETDKLPSGTPKGVKDFPGKENPHRPPVGDPPVPNRAHTEMGVPFPPEFPPRAPGKEI